MFMENIFFEINYFDHFYFIRVYLNLFHAALLASGTHPIHYIVYSSRKITKSGLDVDSVYILQYFVSTGYIDIDIKIIISNHI